MAYLTDKEIVNIREPGEYPIGGTGVNIVVSELKGGKFSYRWIQYIYIKDPVTQKTRRRRISLKAIYPELLSGEARKIGKVNQEIASQGIDPTDVREDKTPEEQTLPPIFRELAEEVFGRESERVAKGKLTEDRLHIFRISLNHLPAGHWR